MDVNYYNGVIAATTTYTLGLILIRMWLEYKVIGSISHFFQRSYGGCGLEKALCSKLKSINAFYHCK